MDAETDGAIKAQMQGARGNLVAIGSPNERIGELETGGVSLHG